MELLFHKEAEQIKRKAFIIHLKKEGKGGEKGEMNVRWIAVLLVLSALAIAPAIALDTTPPRVFNQSASPSEIANDGSEYSELTVHVVDNTAIDDVTIDLTPIGGGIVHMICKGNYTKNGEVVGIFNWTTNANCPPGIYSLKINVTDIAGNYNDTASIILGVSLMADSLGVDDASGSPGSYVEVPVIINNTKNGPIESIGFYIEYNKSVINLTAERIKTGDLTAGWILMPEIGTDRDLIMLTGVFATPIPNGSTGSVAILNFSVVGKRGDSSPVNISEIKIKNVAGEEGTAPAKNATFKIPLLQMADSLGVDDASGSPGSYVEVPVIINNTKNGPIESIGFYIEYNKSVINLTTERISVGDLTSDWVCIAEIGEDKDLIILAGGTPIANGSTGSVAILNFSVVGGYGNTSPINITEIRMKNVADERGTAPAKNATFSVGLWGDLNNNGIPADRDDVILMLKAYLGFIEPDERYDLNNNGIPADRDDVILMLKAYLGFI